MSAKEKETAELLREVEDLRRRLAELEGRRAAGGEYEAEIESIESQLAQETLLMYQPEDFITKILGVTIEQLLRLGVPIQGYSLQVVNEAGDDFIALSRSVAQRDDRRWTALLEWGRAWKKMSDNTGKHPWILETWQSGQTYYQPRFEADWDAGREVSLVDAPFAGGTLAINNRAPDAFSARDIEVLGRVAPLLDRPFARFLELLAGQREERRQRDEAEIRVAMDELGQVVGQMSAPEDLLVGLMVVVWEKLRLLGVAFDSCGMQVVNEAGDDFIGVGRFIPNIEGRPTPEWTTMLASGRSWGRMSNYVEDFPWVFAAWRTGEPRFTHFSAEESPFNSARSVLDVPFAYGTMAINSKAPDAFSARDVEILQHLAPILKQGIERFLVLAETRRRQRRNAMLQRVRSAIGGMRGSSDIDEVMAVVREGLLEMEIAFVQGGANVIDAEGGVRIFTIVREDPHGHWVDLVVPEAAEAIVGLWREQRVVYRKDLVEDDPFGEDQWLDEVRSVIDVPFSHGTLAFNSHLPAAFTDEHVEILREIAGALSEGFRRMDDLRALEEQNRLLQREAAERERAEEELRHAQKMEVVGQLTAGVAHNFNNKLMGVLYILEEAIRGAGGELKDRLETAHLSAQEAAEIVAQLMTYSRKERDAAYRPTPVDDLIAKVGDLCRDTFDRKIQIETRPSNGSLAVAADANQLEQVLLNICLNARDAMAGIVDRTPTLELRAEEVELAPEGGQGEERAGRYIRLQVTDNGAGMDEAVAERVFDPFFTTKDVGVGTGLGLSTAFGIIRQHEGWIECESQVGSGTTFSIYLPVTDERAVVAEPVPVAGPGSGSILVIDDEELVVDALTRTLKRKGYAVHTARRGAEGLEIFRREKIDLVILDLSMPGMSGREVLRQLLDLDPAVKVVVATGFLDEEVSGALAVLQKPVVVADLLNTVDAAIKN